MLFNISVKKIFLLFFNLTAISVTAQIASPFDATYAEKKNATGIQSGYFFASTGITNEFARAYLKYSFLDSAIKDNVLERLSGKNSMGTGFDASVYFTQKKEKVLGISNGYYWIGAGNRLYADALFTKDLFEVFFYGNKAFEGKTADFSGFHLNYLAWKHLTLGVRKESEKMDWSVGVSLLAGQDNFYVHADRATLFTKEDGEYLDADVKMTIRQTDTLNSGFGAFNGFGAGTNLMLNFKLSPASTIRFELYDAGIIFWNSQSVITQADTAYRFTGLLSVDNLFDLNDTVITQSVADSTEYERFLDSKEAKSYNTLLPALVSLSYSKVIRENKFSLTLGAAQRISPAYRPRIYAYAKSFFTPKFAATFGLAYGGFSQLNFTLGIAADFGKGLIFSATSHFAEGYLVPASTTAQGVKLQLKKFF